MRKETLDAVFGETEDGEELDASERLDLELPPDVDRALRIRRLIGSASIKKLDAMEACVMSDSRARGLLLYHGAGPGRWAGKLIQPHNFPRGSVIEDDRIESLVDAIMTGDPGMWSAMYGPAVEAVVSSLRHTIVAAPGHTLVAGDYAGIEARVVLALSGQHDKMCSTREGADVYIDMACDIYGVDKLSPTDPRYKEWCKEFKRDHLEWRQTGRTACSAAASRWATTSSTTATARTKSWSSRNAGHSGVPQGLGTEGPRAVAWAGAGRDPHRPREPAARGLWRGVPPGGRVDDRSPALGPQAVVLPPSPDAQGHAVGRGRYPSVLELRRHQARPAHPRGRLRRPPDRERRASPARDLLRAAMLKCRKERLPIILTVHDEIVLEVPEARADEKALAQIMEDIPDWARAIRVPVDVETWAGEGTASRFKRAEP
jgi:DNA polymerase